MRANCPVPSLVRLGSASGSADIDLALWLVRIAGDGLHWPPADGGAELARWAWEAVPARDRDALSDIWRSMLGLDPRPPTVIRLDRSLSVDRALRVLGAVRRRAKGALQDERSGRWRHEVPVGDLHHSAA